MGFSMASLLEDKVIESIIKGEAVELEEALLILSGLQSKEAIDGYKKKIGVLQEGFHKYAVRGTVSEGETPPEQVAKALHDCLWEDNPNRYNGNFLLTEVVDAQLSQGSPVGNCVGLTSLFTVLALRERLNPSIMFDSTHVFSRLRTGDKVLDIENTNSDGTKHSIDGFTESPAINLTTLVLNSRGNVKKASGRLEEAVKDYTQAISINPRLAEAYSNRGGVKQAQGRLEEAVKDYTQAISINPRLAEAYSNRGTAKQAQGRLEEAIEDYTQAISINPRLAEAYSNRGIVKKASGRLEEAIEDYTQAISINPRHANAYYNRGTTKQALGRLEEAVKDYTQSITINPRHANAYFNRGIVKGQLGLLTEALNDFRMVLSINPKDKDALRMVEELKKSGAYRQQAAPAIVGHIKDIFRYFVKRH
ncbi:tetratricopeptide repeat protein [Candidatus Woesearchaeota archaeon]|nr:tetratricopeptide repeat protein [Candidatus Woesearchaeota archaeon]